MVADFILEKVLEAVVGALAKSGYKIADRKINQFFQDLKKPAQNRFASEAYRELLKENPDTRKVEAAMALSKITGLERKELEGMIFKVKSYREARMRPAKKAVKIAAAKRAPAKKKVFKKIPAKKSIRLK
jgi:Glu-tRNA(Gln) amidotransferase subunit E-like FAD-binding protein